MWPYPWKHVGTPSHLGHMDRVAATMPSQAHAGAAQEAPDIGQWEGQDVPLVRPSSCNVKRRHPELPEIPTYLPTCGHRTEGRCVAPVRSAHMVKGRFPSHVRSGHRAECRFLSPVRLAHRVAGSFPSSVRSGHRIEGSCPVLVHSGHKAEGSWPALLRARRAGWRAGSPPSCALGTG